MQMAVITDEFDADLGRALDIMAEYDVRSAELRGIWDKNIADASDEYIDRAESVLKAKGARVACIASPFYKCSLDPATEAEGPAGPLHAATAKGLADQIDLLNRCVEIAKRLDTRLIRVFSFWRKGQLTPDIEDRIVDAFAEPVDIAARAGITLVLENEHACFIGTGKETARLLEKVGSPYLRAVWDPANAFMAGEAPFPAGYDALAPFIQHVHVKDARATDAGGEYTVVGDGECRWPEQIAALKAAGYNGYLSMEQHYSGTGSKEEFSRACLAATIKMVADA